MDREPEKKIEFTSFVGWGFQALILAVGTWGVSELSSLSKSVQELNVKMAVTMERDIMRGEEMRVFRVQIEEYRARLNAIEAKVH
jgi:hypothetical protein